MWTSRPVALDCPGTIFISVAAGAYHSVAVDHLYRVWTWGWGVHGQLGHGNTDTLFWPKLIADFQVMNFFFVTESKMRNFSLFFLSFLFRDDLESNFKCKIEFFW